MSSRQVAALMWVLSLGAALSLFPAKGGTHNRPTAYPQLEDFLDIAATVFTLISLA